MLETLSHEQLTHFEQPAEWEKHAAVWLAWPSHADLWQESLLSTQKEFIAFCQAIADVDPVTRQPRGETLHILAPTAEAFADAEKALAGLGARFHLIPFGDIWLRDTGPIFVRGRSGESASVRFQFNSWGSKYDLPHDPDVGVAIGIASGLPQFALPFVLEGGAVEVDGEGTCLTSRQCLLNPNRNPNMSESDIETALKQALGVRKILWVDQGLKNDHTDGHIDTIARFVAPGVVVCMTPQENDPNAETLQTIERTLRSMTDARGRRLRVETVPSPGALYDEDHQLMPASYVNFYIANTTVIVPTYGCPHDANAVAAIARCFPGRKTIGLSAKSILLGGGAFHCISQQQPL